MHNSYTMIHQQQIQSSPRKVIVHWVMEIQMLNSDGATFQNKIDSSSLLCLFFFFNGKARNILWLCHYGTAMLYMCLFSVLKVWFSPCCLQKFMEANMLEDSTIFFVEVFVKFPNNWGKNKASQDLEETITKH